MTHELNKGTVNAMSPRKSSQSIALTDKQEKNDF